MSSVTAERHLTLVRQPAPTPVRARPALRLTRRGRLVVLLVAVVALALALGWGAQSVKASAESTGSATAYVAVQPGDTLWDIARTVAPGDDPRDVVARITELNALPSSSLAPGQLLVVPARQ